MMPLVHDNMYGGHSDHINRIVTDLSICFFISLSLPLQATELRSTDVYALPRKHVTIAVLGLQLSNNLD